MRRVPPLRQQHLPRPRGHRKENQRSSSCGSVHAHHDDVGALHQREHSQRPEARVLRPRLQARQIRRHVPEKMLGFNMSTALKKEVDLLSQNVQLLLRDHEKNVAKLFILLQESTQLNAETRKYYTQAELEPEPEDE